MLRDPPVCGEGESGRQWLCLIELEQTDITGIRPYNVD
jgi:hypothetical protein